MRVLQFAGRRPGVEPAVEHGRVAAYAVEHPPQPRCDDSADVVVGDDRSVVADPQPAHGRREVLGRRQRMAAALGGGRAREIDIEVDETRPTDVPRSYASRPERPSRYHLTSAITTASAWAASQSASTQVGPVHQCLPAVSRPLRPHRAPCRPPRRDGFSSTGGGPHRRCGDVHRATCAPCMVGPHEGLVVAAHQPTAPATSASRRSPVGRVEAGRGGDPRNRQARGLR